MLYGEKKYPHLFSPGQIGKIKTKNRFIKTANGTSLIERDGYVGDRAIAYYEALAKGGIGLLIVESCGVEFPLACQHLDCQFRLSDDKYIPSYAELAKAVHAQGVPIMVQFQHAGPWNPTGLIPDRDTKAASALTKEELPGPDFMVPRAMSRDEIYEAIETWVKAGERAWKAGFDGVEINGGTCHQINTFFSRIWNRREDEFGPQSLENRARFMCEVIKRTKERCGPDFTVTCLFNIQEYNHPLATTKEEGIGFAKLVEAAGADAIQGRAHIYGHREGLLQPDRLLYPEAPKWLNTIVGNLDWSRKGHGATWPMTYAVKQVVKIPTWVSGRLDYKLGEEFIRDGKMDFLPMVRRLLADHDYPNKLLNHQEKEIKPCNGCLHCMDVRNRNQCVECRVNIDLGKERQYVIKPAAKKKNVMVIGGGLAGMHAAHVAASRGHKVTLYEERRRLGGLVPIAALVKDLETDVLLDTIAWNKRQLKNHGVKVVLGKKVTIDFIKEQKPDVVVLALGGIVTFPDVKGIDGKNVMDLTKLDGLLTILGPKLSDFGAGIMMPGVGKHVVVMGGEHHGCEIAEWLTKKGRKVTICHTGTVFAEGMTGDDMMRLIPWFEEKGVKLYGGVKYEEVTDKGVVITTQEGKKMLIEADTVMPSLFLKRNLGMEEQLKGIVPEVYRAGSCVKPEPDLMADATRAGGAIGHAI